MDLSRKTSLLAAALCAAVAVVAPTAPASASGITGTYNGCYAQWWNTYAGGYCNNTPGTITVRLNVNCSWGLNHSLPWHTLSGSVNPFDEFECTWGVDNATLSFQ